MPLFFAGGRAFVHPNAIRRDLLVASDAKVSKSTALRWAYFPFGGGSRSCIGEAFAWVEAIVVLATLVRCWRFGPVPNAVPIRLEPGITLRPGNAVELNVFDRS